MSEDTVSIEDPIEEPPVVEQPIELPPPDPSEEPPALAPEPEPVTVSIEAYEAAREAIVASGNPDPDDATIVVAAVESQTGNLPPVEPIEENNV